jgi:hypothetical protein
MYTLYSKRVHIVRNRWFNVGPGLTNKKKSRAKPKNKRATDIPVVGVETEVDSDETEEAGPSRKKIQMILQYMCPFLAQPLLSAVSPTNLSKRLRQKSQLALPSPPIPRPCIHAVEV